MKNFFFGLCTICFFIQGVKAQDKPASDAAELAKKLANPIASLISVPFQSNWDMGIGNNNGSKMVLNFQPVIPMQLSKKMNFITRWIIPFASQKDVTGDKTNQSGLGDAVITGFFSPVGSKITWGVGPVLVLPIASNQFLGGEKFCIGPSVVALKQSNGWTVGGLANHVFSVAGNANRKDISATFLNPFIAYNWKSGAGLTLNAEYTHDWENKVDVFVIQPIASAVTKFGTQIVSISVGPRFHFAPSGHAAYGVRASISLVFPK